MYTVEFASGIRRRLRIVDMSRRLVPYTNYAIYLHELHKKWDMLDASAKLDTSKIHLENLPCVVKHKGLPWILQIMLLTVDCNENLKSIQYTLGYCPTEKSQIDLYT